MTQGRYADAEPLGKLALAIWEKAPARADGYRVREDPGFVTSGVNSI
jgi:hypothetical protein